MKYWASEPIDDLQIKVKIMICISIIAFKIQTCIAWYVSAERICEIHNRTLSSLALTLKMMSWPSIITNALTHHDL